MADELPASRRLERMRAAPRAGWSIDDVVASAGSTRSAASHLGGGGSHYRVAHPAMPQKLTIPFKRPIKPVYIRQLVAFLDLVRSLP